MATVNAVVLKHHKKNDGTWNVKICVNHKSTPRYIETPAYVTKAYLDSKGKLKRSYIDRYFSRTLDKYRDAITRLGTKINFMDPSELRDYLLLLEHRGSDINIIAEIEKLVNQVKKQGRASAHNAYHAVLNHLKDFLNSDKLSSTALTPNMLMKFEQYLRQDKVLVRYNGTRETEKKGLDSNGVINYMNAFRTLVRAIRKEHNNPSIDYIPIPLNPFDFYQFPTPTIRSRRNLPLESIVQIKNMEPVGKMERMSRDMFMLSFYLCGMNPKDMYVYLTQPNHNGFIEYARSKIKDRRKDGGVTNVLIPHEADEIIKIYAGEIQKYKRMEVFRALLCQGWTKLSKRLGYKVTMYYARHSFSNIARQVCKFSKDDVSFALNHKYGIDITDAYMDPDWSVVHKVQIGVIEALRQEEAKGG